MNTLQLSGGREQSIIFPRATKVRVVTLRLRKGRSNYTIDNGADVVRVSGVDPADPRQKIWDTIVQGVGEVVPGLWDDGVEERYFGTEGVHTPTGNYSETYADMTVSTVLGDVDITRTYNSLDQATDSAVGRGFTFNYAMRVEGDAFGSDKRVILPDGSRWNFTQNASGGYDAQDSRGVLKQVGTDYVLETLDQMRYTFDASGYIRHVEDFKGNRITLGTDALGRVATLTDPAGAHVTFTYDGSRLASVRDERYGKTATYTYSGEFLFQAVDAWGRTTRYQYNRTGKLSSVYDNLGHATTVLAYYVEGDYDGRVYTLEDTFGNVRTHVYDHAQNRTTITDSNGRTTIEGHDPSLAVNHVTNAEGMAESVEYLLTDGKNKYNEVRKSTDAYGNATTYERDAQGRVIRTTYPDGAMETSTFDALGNETSRTDRNGSVTWLLYEDCNLVKEVKPLNGLAAYQAASPDNYMVTSYEYYTAAESVQRGLVKTMTGPMGDADNQTRYAYDASCRLQREEKVVDGVPYATVYAYDAAGRVQATTDPDGTVTRYTYNGADLVVLEEVETTDGVVRHKRTTYDGMGRKKLEIHPEAYDPANDDLPNGYSDKAREWTQYSYDSAGLLLEKENPMRETMRYGYDLYGNVTRKTLPDSSYYTYTYDVMDRQTSETLYDAATGGTMRLGETSYAHRARATT